MRFKAQVQNAYLRASNLAHLPKQTEWSATTRGVKASKVKSAYSSQECSVCYYTHRKNRPDQQTFCYPVYGYREHADLNAAKNIARRSGDTQLRACKIEKRSKPCSCVDMKHGTEQTVGHSPTARPVGWFANRRR